jgi:hypothetical protein
MALVGKWIQYIDVDSETETILQTIIYPKFIPENDPDHEKAGTTQEVEVPVIIRTEKIYTDVYVNVHSINTFKLNDLSGQRNYMNICYRVYKNKEVSLNDVYDFIFEEHLMQKEVDYLSDLTISEQAYEFLKMELGFENLIND